MVKKILWWLCLVIAPAVLIALELFHPAHFTAKPGMYEFLSHAHDHDPQFAALAYFGPHWWLTLHMIQLPMIGLVAVGLWQTVDGIADGPAAVVAWLARIAVFVFFIYFTALDAIGGIGLGQTILTVQHLEAAGKLSREQLDAVVNLLNTMWVDPLVGGVGSFISLTASWAAFASAVLISATLLLARRVPWFTVLPLLAFGWELQTSHASPHGPVAFALLTCASLSMAWYRRAR